MTKEQIKFLKDMDTLYTKYNRNPFLYEICAELNNTPQAIRKLIKACDIKYPEKLMITPVAREVYKKYEEGMTVAQLARKCGYTYSNVSRMIDQLIFQGAVLKTNYVKSTETLILKPEKVLITDGKFEGETALVKSITHVYNLVLPDGSTVTKEGWQIRFAEDVKKLKSKQMA